MPLAVRSSYSRLASPRFFGPIPAGQQNGPWTSLNRTVNEGGCVQVLRDASIRQQTLGIVFIGPS